MVQNIWVFYSHSLKTREKYTSFAQYVDIIVNFIIQKLKSKHTFLKKYTNWAKLGNERRKQQQIFRTLDLSTCDYDMFDFMEPN